MEFSKKVIRTILDTLEEPKYKDMFLCIVEEAIKAGKLPLNPTHEQMQNLRIDFVMMAFCKIVLRDEQYKGRVLNEVSNI
jgi:hypothetical protein